MTKVTYKQRRTKYPALTIAAKPEKRFSEKRSEKSKVALENWRDKVRYW